MEVSVWEFYREEADGRESESRDLEVAWARYLIHVLWEVTWDFDIRQPWIQILMLPFTLQAIQVTFVCQLAVFVGAQWKPTVAALSRGSS